jgi:hypothetical protein
MQRGKIKSTLIDHGEVARNVELRTTETPAIGATL